MPVAAAECDTGRDGCPLAHLAQISRRNPANLLSLLRIALAAPAVTLILSDGTAAREMAASLFIVGGLTDLADGYVARRWGWDSSFGAALDPLADKALIDGCILALAARGRFPFGLTGLFVGRDLLITALRLHGGRRGGVLRPGLLAKSKTLLLFAGLTGVIAGPRLRPAVLSLSWTLVALAAALSALSALQYLGRLLRTPTRA